MEIKERTQGIKKKLSHGRLKVTRHCLPDFPDISSLSDLLLQPTPLPGIGGSFMELVIRNLTRMHSVCAMLPVPEARHGGFVVLFCCPDPEVPSWN
ncbi:hypothetical protein ACSBR2_030735 [Camellia fascicularis]